MTNIDQYIKQPSASEQNNKSLSLTYYAKTEDTLPHMPINPLAYLGSLQYEGERWVLVFPHNL